MQSILVFTGGGPLINLKAWKFKINLTHPNLIHVYNFEVYYHYNFTAPKNIYHNKIRPSFIYKLYTCSEMFMFLILPRQ